MEEKVFAIIGSGPAGYKAALELRNKFPDAKIYLFEKNKLGGTCLHRGCIPSKQLHSVTSFEEFTKSLKKTKLLLEKGLTSELKAASIEIIMEEATVSTENDSVFVNSLNHNLKVDYLVLALGSKPRKLNSAREIFTSDDFFSDDFLVKPMAQSYCFIGGGYISVELASMLASLGAKVKILEKEKNILGFLDEQLRSKLIEYLERQGIVVKTSVNDLDSVKEELVIANLGREAQSEDEFALDKTLLDKKIFSIGDMHTAMPLAHYAYYQAREVAKKIYALEQSPNEAETQSESAIDLTLVPQVIFTKPELAHIGMDLIQAKEAYGDSLRVIEKSWATNAKARIIKEDRAYFRMLYEEKDKKILGYSLIGKGATDLISIPVPILSKALTLDDVENMIFPHPTLGELFAL